jgi:hypothetical protein
MYEIEKNVPVPPRKKVTVYPFHQMKKGDSFFIPVKGKKAQESRRRSATAAAYKQKVKITARVMEDGVRIWRIV